jgi:DNA-binding transcriptional MocR family regulator
LLHNEQRCSPETLIPTHTQISKLLGVSRTSISIATREVKLMRYINKNRGRIELLKTPALQALAKFELIIF